MSTAQAKPTKSNAKVAAPLHPPYLQMITEAISALKERGGSSSLAIGKYIEGKYKTQLPSNFRKLLIMQLRRFAKSTKLVKVKNSFKVGSVSAATGEKKPVGRPPKAGAATKKRGRPSKVAGEKKAAVKPAKAAGEKKAVKKSSVAAKPAAVKKAPKPGKTAKPAPVKKVKTLRAAKSPSAKKSAAPKAGRPAAAKKAKA